jgi:hypothetical protein
MPFTMESCWNLLVVHNGNTYRCPSYIVLNELCSIVGMTLVAGAANYRYYWGVAKVGIGHPWASLWVE